MDNDLTRMRLDACEKIKYYRRIRKYSQAEMADRLWMSRRAYLRLEKGETAMTLERLQRISQVLEVSIGNLLGLEAQTKNEDLLKEFASLNEYVKLNEQKILELLNELKRRLS